MKNSILVHYYSTFYGQHVVVPTESTCIPLPICLCAYFMHSEALPSNSFDLHRLYPVLLFLTKSIDLCSRPKLCLYLRSTRIRTGRERNTSNYKVHVQM